MIKMIKVLCEHWSLLSGSRSVVSLLSLYGFLFRSLSVSEFYLCGVFCRSEGSLSISGPATVSLDAGEYNRPNEGIEHKHTS